MPNPYRVTLEPDGYRLDIVAGARAGTTIRWITDRDVAAMRDWLADIDFADIDSYELPEQPDSAVILAVQRIYEGGILAFLRDEHDRRYLAATAWQFEGAR